MALVTSMISPSHYGTQHSGYYQSPPSPPMDEPKCSLPSISNLLGLADAGSMASESSYSSSPRPYAKAESRPASRHRALPPTPPMSTDASFDARRSPSNSVSYAPSSTYYETTPPAEAHDTHRYRMASLPAISTSTAQPPLPPAMGSAHSAHSAHSPASNYYPAQSLPPPPPPASGLQYQRALPLSFPPPPSPLSVTPSGGYVWQHHHYLNPSNGIPFPPSQDRYICQTCNKAFSRPSSLRIHSHSHTGEKPFKCPHAGCGKAFSVRSNMKRHERGCHGFDVGKGPIMLP